MVGAFYQLLCRGYLQPACRDTHPPAHLEKRPDKVRFAVRACPHSSYLAFHLLICTYSSKIACVCNHNIREQARLFPVFSTLSGGRSVVALLALTAGSCRALSFVAYTHKHFRLTFVVFVPPGAHAVSRTHADFCVLLWL